jgi:hypothetical protein
VNMQGRKQRVWLSLLALGSLCLPLVAQGTQEAKSDYSKVQAPIRSFEGYISQIVARTMPGSFALVGKPRGWLEDRTGYNFLFNVNIQHGLVSSPMGVFKTGPDITPDQKRQAVETMKDLLIRLLYSQGVTMPQLRKDKAITIVGIFDDPDPIEGNVQKTLILSVLKSDIDEFSNGGEHFNEFKQRVKIVEYSGNTLTNSNRG